MRTLGETMTCDPKDRHALAAGVRSDAAVLVTFNTDDFVPEHEDLRILAESLRASSTSQPNVRP